MQGNGVMTYSNGSIYDGEWADGLQHGEGTADDKANKTAYTGKWKAGKLRVYSALITIFHFFAPSFIIRDSFRWHWTAQVHRAQGAIRRRIS
jgi:hypothetical protein